MDLGSTIDVRSSLLALDVYYGWFVVASCFLGGFVVYGLQYSFSVFFGHLVTAFGLSHANTSLIFSLQSLTLYVGAAGFGFTIDRYDVRRLFGAGTLLTALGLFGTAFVPTYSGMLVFYGVVVGLGLSIVMVISFVTPVLWFDRRRGIATGVATSGAGLGITILPPLTRWTISLLGWRRAYYALAVFVTLAVSVATLLIADQPERLDVDTSREFITKSDTATRSLGTIREQWHGMRANVFSWPFALFFIGFLGAYLTPLSLIVVLVEFTRSVGLGGQAGVLILSSIGATNTIGKFLTGYLADRLHTMWVLGGCALVGGAFVVPITLVHHPGAMLVLSVPFGLAFGGLGALMTPAMAELFDVRNLNGLFGIVSLSTAVAGALGPYVVNYSFDSLGTYIPALIGVGFVSVIAAGILLLVQRVNTPRGA